MPDGVLRVIRTALLDGAPRDLAGWTAPPTGLSLESIQYPAPDATGYLAWAPHPKDGAEAPAAFALVNRLGSGRNHLAAFYVLPHYRRGGLGRRVVRDVVGRHPGGWEIAFQHENEPAIRFWRSIATDLWGDAWVETEEPVPDVDVPPDHWIRTT